MKPEKNTTGTRGNGEPPKLPADSMLPLWRQIHGEFQLHMRKWNLPVGEYVVLLGLLRRPLLDEPSEIARLHYLPRQTTTFLLDALERKRLALRKPHPSDRRRKVVRFTPKGRALASAMFRDMLAFEAQALRGLDPARLAAARTLLQRYADGLTAANGSETRP